MRTIRTGMAALLMTVGGLAIPGNAEACYVAFTSFAVHKQGVEIVASAEAQVMEAEYGSCATTEYVQFPLHIELQTPLDVLYDDDTGFGFPFGSEGVMVNVAIASYRGGAGWYVPTAWLGSVYAEAPLPEYWTYGPTYADCYSQCDYYVPAFVLELRAPIEIE